MEVCKEMASGEGEWNEEEIAHVLPALKSVLGRARAAEYLQGQFDGRKEVNPDNLLAANPTDPTNTIIRPTSGSSTKASWFATAIKAAREQRKTGAGELSE